MEEEEDLGSWLGLGIGGGSAPSRSHGEDRRPWSAVQFPHQMSVNHHKEETTMMRGRDRHNKQGEKKSSEKGGASLIRKRLKDARSSSSLRRTSPSEVDADGDDGGDGSGTRKKLRLTKEQSTLLEDTFRSHNILSHAQKHELARRVNLTPRQVEVWFQNRRARTKLKQTEVDCELLKRCCESLTDENQRLKRELGELQRSAAAAGRLYVRTVSACPSCENKVITVASSDGETSKSSSYSS